MLRVVLTPLSRLANVIAIAANVAGTLVVLTLVAVVNYDVVARGVYNKPFLGAVEVVQFSMVLIVFLQLPDVVRVNRLTASDGFLGYLDRRSRFGSRLARRARNALSAVFMAIVAYAMWPEFWEMWHSNDFFGVPGVFTAPWWPIKLVILASAGLCAIIFALKVIIPTASDEPGLDHP